MAMAEAGAGNQAVAGRGIVKAASWSGFEICDTNRPVIERKMVVAEAGVGNKAVVGTGIVKTAAAEGKAKPAGRRTKLVEVDQQFIDCILDYRAACPLRLRSFPSKKFDDIVDVLFEDNPEARERAREAAAYMKQAEDRDDEILRQYRSNGYAYMEMEVWDDED